MSVAVQHEDTEALAAWGMGLSRVQERCIFCRVETRYWYSPKNQPCCQACAATKDAADFEKKVEMVEEIKDLTQARRVITQLRGLVAERDNILGKRPCQNSRCNELNAARALLREVSKDGSLDMGNTNSSALGNRVRAYIDACDKPGEPTLAAAQSTIPTLPTASEPNEWAIRPRSRSRAEFVSSSAESSAVKPCPALVSAVSGNALSV